MEIFDEYRSFFIRIYPFSLFPCPYGAMIWIFIGFNLNLQTEPKLTRNMRRFTKLFALFLLCAASMPAIADNAEFRSVADNDADEATAVRRQAKEDFSLYPALSDEFKGMLGIAVNAGRPIVIDFSATWCGPCLNFAPTFRSFASRYKGKIDMVSCDVDRFRAIAATYRAYQIPNVLLFDNEGRPVERYIGAPSSDRFTESLERLLQLSVDDIRLDDEAEFYTLQGVKTENPAKGIYIRVSGGKASKVMIK